MPVHRSGPTPFFYEYVTRRALIPNHSTSSSSLIKLGVFEWVQIPNFQRGISWDVDKVQEFLESSSELLGNVILGQFSRPAAQFPRLDPVVNSYLVLIDGLQRFSVGTMLLAILNDFVLRPVNPMYPAEAPHFSSLAAIVNSHAAVFLHNDAEFLNHPRKAIADQYRILRDDLGRYIVDIFTKGLGHQFAQQVLNSFLQRQIAVDIYFNFPSQTAIMSTFLGINTVRVDLGPVDLVRSLIIDKGTSSLWSDTDIEAVENMFTEVFTLNEKEDPTLAPFARAVLKTLNDGNGINVFPSWNTSLSKADVDDFLDFVQLFKISTHNGYFEEIRECGSVPLAILIAYYYVKYLASGRTKPLFLTTPSPVAEDAELQAFLIACYRRILDGSIGRLRHYADGILDGTIVPNLSSVANSISVDALGIKVTDPLDPNWLKTALNRVNKLKARRVFNAMILPLKSAGLGASGFSPLNFGRASTDFHVDHLIPESMLNGSRAGYQEGQTLRNFAPLPTNNNRAAKATSCSVKLSTSGMYVSYLSGTTHRLHPYCDWLVNTHSTLFSTAALDDQRLLEPNTTPAIGSQRVDHIADELLSRI